MASVDRVTPKNVKLSQLKSSKSVVNRPTLSVEMSEVSGSQFNLVLYNALENLVKVRYMLINISPKHDYETIIQRLRCKLVKFELQIRLRRRMGFTTNF